LKAAGERVFVVDDDPAIVRSLSRLLRSAGFSAETYGSPEEFLSRFDPAARGCLVLDVSMPGSDGLALQEALSARGSFLPILFLTGRGDIPTSVQAMKRGAVDFLTKPADDVELLRAVRLALQKNRAERRTDAELSQLRKRLATLTPREREVFRGVVAGRLNKQIAADLGIAEKTIKVHRGRVMDKMAAESLADLVRMAERLGPS